MTSTMERTEPESPEELALDTGGRPRWRDETVAIESVIVEGFGAPPETWLLNSVRTSGVTTPVQLREVEPGRFKVIDGRRRILAAGEAGDTEVPARICVSGDPDVLDSVLGLQANDAASPNPLVELELIETLVREGGTTVDLVTIAKVTGVRLKTLKRRMKLANMRHELRKGGLEGRFGTKVAEAAARCDAVQQGELVKRMEAAGKLTMDDVREVKRTHVEGHQRTLPGDRWKTRVRELLTKARDDLFMEAGKVEAYELIGKAIEALDELDD